MGQYTSYFLYQKFEQRGEQEAIPVYPNVYSIDADGTRERVVKIQDDPQCGYDPPIKPIYKWVNIPITQDYICDDCPEYQTRWVRTDDTICSGTPTPVSKKLVATYTGGITNEVECNDNPTLTSGETQPSGYVTSAMTSAVIGDCVTTIGEDAFYDCRSLTSINMPNSVTNIGDFAFRWCSSLTSVSIGSGVTSIGEGAFSYCRSLTSVTIPDSVTNIGEAAFSYCDGLTSVAIGSGVTSIGKYIFHTCTSLTSVVIPDSVTSIGINAFNTCISLTSVTIPDSVTSIGRGVFNRCSGLTSVAIGSGVTSIGYEAFFDCASLTSVTCLATTPPTLGDNVFYNTNNCPLLVPAQSLDAYKTATNWSTYASRIQPIT